MEGEASCARWRPPVANRARSARSTPRSPLCRPTAGRLPWAETMAFLYAAPMDPACGGCSSRLVPCPTRDGPPTRNASGTRWSRRQPFARIWEVLANGTGSHPLLPGSKQACCGTWTPDGRSLVEADQDGDYAIWALADQQPGWWRRSASTAPVKLTSGPMRYENVMPGPDGRSLLALGTSPSMGELVRFDAKSGRFEPMLRGIAARDLDYSRDGEWMVLVDNADATVWRSRVDGTDRRQLTFPPALASWPRWSPDGTRIVSCSRDAGGASRIHHRRGGRAAHRTHQARTKRRRPQLVARRASTGVRDSLHERGERRCSDRIEDVQTTHVSAVPGSEGLFSPRWSPDGRAIVAIALGSSHLMLYEFQTGRWRELVSSSVGWPSWTRDSTEVQVQQGRAIVRVRVADGRVTRVASVEGIRQVMLPGGESSIGMAPDTSPMLLGGQLAAGNLRVAGQLAIAAGE